MPLTTPLLPSPSVAISPAFLDTATPNHHEPPVRLASSDPDFAPAAAPHIITRRLTLSRFPLLRKGSRDHSHHAHYHAHHHAHHAHHHARGKSISTPALPAIADSPFLTTGAPRASSSFARASVDHHSPSPAPPARLSHDAERLSQELPNTQQPAHLQRAGHPAKMHQTSSRLLRMTDDERPYTRVSGLFFLLFLSSVSCSPLTTLHTMQTTSAQQMRVIYFPHSTQEPVLH